MIGVGAGMNANKAAKEVNAAESSVSWTATSGGLGSGIGSGTISTGSYSWSYTRTLKSGTSYSGWTSNCIQLGKNGGVENLSLTTSAIPGIIKSVSVECSSYQGKHNVSITVGSSTYLASTATSSWTTVSAKTGTGTSSGAITISFTGGTRALYIKSLNVVYDTAVAPETYYTVSFETNGATPIPEEIVADDNNTPVEKPTDPEKRGYVFGGWYKEGMTEEYNFDNPVEGNMTLYAKWEKVDVASTYSPSMSNGDYRIAGEVTAITGSSEFFVQSGNNAMHVGGDNYTTSLQNGNSVDLFGTYVASSTTIGNLAYCDKTAEDTDIEQAYLSNLNDVTEANLCKYVRIENIQLASGFDANSKKASIKNSELIVFYNAKTKVDNNTFEPNDYAANDYVSVHGVVYKHKDTSELGLYITHIEKPAQFVVTFDYNDGRGTYTTQNVLSGGNAQAPVAPTKPSDVNYNYSFAGWYTDEACNNAYNFSTAVASSFPLYAKWERVQRDASEVIEGTLKTNSSLSYSAYTQTGFGIKDTLDREFTGKTGTSYGSDWTKNISTSGVTYVGNSAGDNGAIQLRSSSNSGIVTTTAALAGNATKVTVAWESHTADGRTLNVYGKNTAYEAPADLYDASKQGELLGTIVCGTSTTLEITGDYAYIGFRSNGSAMYLSSVEIQWGEDLNYDYTDLKIRFAAKVSEELWTRLNNESTITGYGMLLSTTDAINNEHIDTHYASAKDYRSSLNVKSEVVNFPNTKATPNLSEGNYGWSLHKSIPEADYTTTFIAVAYIITEDDGVLFMDEIRASAKSLAGDLIQNGTYEEDAFGGSLKFLADR